MVLEWIRRRDAAFDQKLREYLFTDGSIVGREGKATNGDGATGGRTARAPLTLGSLRGGR